VLEDGGPAASPWVRMNLAVALFDAGDEARALEIRRDLLSDLNGEGITASHPLGRLARLNLAESLRAAGDLAGAAALLGEVQLAQADELPEHHLEVQTTRMNLAWVDAALGEDDRARAEVAHLLQGLSDWSRSGLVLAPRERRERAAWASFASSAVLSLLDEVGADRQLARRAFSVIESLRAMEAGESRIPSRERLDPRVDARRLAVLEARRRVSDLAQDWRESPDADHGRELAAAVLERDREEAELSRTLAGRGWASTAVDVDALAAGLADDALAVGYVVYRREELEPEAPGRTRTTESLLAHVLAPHGELARVELGPVSRVEETVAGWRASLGVEAGRGERIVKAGGPAADPRSLGEALRALVLDPVLALAGDACVLHVRLDGALHLVPLDALPLADGVVGDRFRVHTEVSFLDRRPAGARTARSTASLLALGGVDFEAAGSAPPAGPSHAPLRDAAHSPSGGFAPLPATRAEVNGIAELFRERFGGEVVLLSGADATKAALFRRAPQARFLHLATHGYFAGVRPAEGVVAASWSPLGELEGPRAAPLAMCGLALAGANRGMDSRGHVAGIVTGEEIAGMDLSACELATLSACETNVGEAENGRSVLSLQAALRAAGVRTAVTSLWRVPDEATRELMLAFYEALWSEGLPKADALWKAKRTLRESGAPPAHWAGWVLTGDPD